MRFGNFNPGTDEQLACQQAPQAFQFGVPGFGLEEARLGLVWTDIPMLGKADLGNAELDGPAAHGFQRIIGIFREERVHMVIKGNLHSVIEGIRIL